MSSTSSSDEKRDNMASLNTSKSGELDQMIKLSISESDELDQRIQKLPQELQDAVKEALLDRFLPTSLIEINADYKPPVGLQLDSKTRESFAEEYYQIGFVHYVSKFRTVLASQASSTYYSMTSYRILRKWLSVLSKTYRPLIDTIEIKVIKTVQPSEMEESSHYENTSLKQIVRTEHHYACAMVPNARGWPDNDVIVFKFTYMEEDDTFAQEGSTSHKPHGFCEEVSFRGT